MEIESRDEGDPLKSDSEGGTILMDSKGRLSCIDHGVSSSLQQTPLSLLFYLSASGSFSVAFGFKD